MTEPVLVDIREGTAIVTLDSPPLNPLDTPMRDALESIFASIDADVDVRAVVITGGSKCFAAGADIRGLAAMGYEEAVVWNRRLQKAFTALTQLRVPVIAAVNGFALGGGMELALAADIRVAAVSAKFGLPEVKLGIMPGSGGTQRLRAHVGPGRAKELMMSGRIVDGAEAHALGIVEEIVGEDEVLDHALDLATTLVSGPRFALAAIKEAVNGSGDGLALERSLIAGLFATEDKARGMDSFLENGPGKARFT